MLSVLAIQPQFFIVPGIALAFLILGFLFFFPINRWFGDDEYGASGFQVSGAVLWVLSAIMVLVSIGISIPFDSKYNVYYKLDGRVESVSNDFKDGSGKLTGTPIVNLSGYSEPIYVTDSRILPLVGKDVSLTCTIVWSPYGLDATKCDLAQIKN